MPNKKKRLFGKNNSVRYLVLPGKAGAVNADGEALPNLLVPVSRGYKQGSSLFLPNLAALGEPAGMAKDTDLAKIMESFQDDSDSDSVESKPLTSQLKNLNFSSKNERSVPSQFASHVIESIEYVSDDDDQSYCSNISDQFSDADDLDQDNFKYLLTSETQNCPESIRTFNERFEKVLETYDDDQIGALDDEEICGHLTTESDRVQDLVNTQDKKNEIITLGSYNDDIKKQILWYAEQDEEEKFVKIVTKAPIEFDCESILSTYSNKYNHPTVIKEEAKIKKIKIPDNPLKKKLTKSQLKHLEKECEDEDSQESDDNCSVMTSYNIRAKGETPEEKRERKNAFKEAKRESRMFKKENKLAFKNETKLQRNQEINSRQNKGIKLL